MLPSLWVTNEVNDGCCSKYSNSQRPPIPDAIKRGSHMNVGYQNYLKEVKESREIKKIEEEEARRLRHEIEDSYVLTVDSDFNVARNQMPILSTANVIHKSGFPLGAGSVRS